MVNSFSTFNFAMASQKMIPRFLLPQASCAATLPRHGANAFLQLNVYALQRTLTISTRTPRCMKPSSSVSTACRKHAARAKALGIAAQAVKHFSTSRNLQRDHHFDTLKFVQRLRDEGFSEEQSKAMMLVLSDVIEESIQNLTRTMVLKEGTEYQYNALRECDLMLTHLSNRCGSLHLYPEG